MRLGRWPEAAPTASRPAAALVGLLLVYLVIAQSVSMLPRLITVDFYQYWAVSAALRLKGTAVGPPYKNSATYVAALAEYASQPGNDRLATVSGIYTRPGFTGTPFLYMLFGVLPLDFTLAVSIYHILQVLLFFSAVIALGVVYRYPPFLLFCLASLLVIASGSLSSDLRVGNVGCVQLAALSGLFVLVHHLPHARHPLALGSLAVSGLTLLTLAKPNVAVIAAAMGLHLLVTRGIRFSAIAAIPALGAGAIAVILPCLYFGSWTIWHSWYGFVFGANTYGLAGAPGPGNYSTTKILGAWLHIHVGTAVRLVAAALALSFLAVVIAAVRADPRARAAPVRSALDKVFGDPHLVMAMAVTVTIALPPLFWYHYYVIALIPGLWFLSVSSRSPALPLLGLVSLALSQGLPNVVLIPLGWTGAVVVAAALAWVPLWAGSLLCVYGVGSPVTDQARVGASTEPRGDRQPEAGPVSRRSRRPRTATRS